MYTLNVINGFAFTEKRAYVRKWLCDFEDKWKVRWTELIKRNQAISRRQVGACYFVFNKIMDYIPFRQTSLLLTQVKLPFFSNVLLLAKYSDFLTL